MSLLSTQLPAELLPMVLAPQFPRDLASTSLVCRQWQRIAFPYLYHAVYLSTSAHLKVLTERLLEKDVPDSLSIPVHLRCLTFGGSIDNNRDMKYLDSIIPRLDRLSCLYWVLPFTPDHFAWFTACPKLKSVDLLPQNIWEDDEWVERLPELLIFTNLTHFSLKFETIQVYPFFVLILLLTLPVTTYDREDEVFDPIGALIQSSPNLEPIVLSFLDPDNPRESYCLTSTLEPLGDQFILPRLHTLHMLGRADLDWPRFASDPTHPFRAFIVRHPSLRDSAVGCPMFPEGTRMDPDDLSRLLPSVRHLGFPSFMWESVLKSDIASRLESLVISDLMFVKYDGNVPLDPLVNAMVEDSLPKLRKIEIWAQFGNTGLQTEVLEAFLSAAKGLEELDFEIHAEGEFLSIMKRAENLRRIKCPEATEANYEVMVKELAKACPRLKEIVACEGGIAWKVVREDEFNKLSLVRTTLDDL